VARDKDQVDGQGGGRPRRALLTGAAAVVGVIAAESLGGAAPAQAAEGSAVIEGADNTGATRRTAVFTTGNKEWATLADPADPMFGSLGVYGHGQENGVIGTAGSSRGVGVFGQGGDNGGIGVEGSGGRSDGIGVQGNGGGTSAGVAGVGGLDGGPGVAGFGIGSSPGVSGQCAMGPSSLGATGVVGIGGFDGVGVRGTVQTGNGIGVFARGGGTGAGVTRFGGADGGVGMEGEGAGGGVTGVATSVAGAGVKAVNIQGGPALSVEGAAVFSLSGIVTVEVGKSSATESNVALTAASLVLAMLQQNVAGVSVQSAVPDVPGSSFTVHLSKAVTASTKVAWFVAN
jgi:hypothetical protein